MHENEIVCIEAPAVSITLPVGLKSFEETHYNLLSPHNYPPGATSFSSFCRVRFDAQLPQLSPLSSQSSWSCSSCSLVNFFFICRDFSSGLFL